MSNDLIETGSLPQHLIDAQQENDGRGLEDMEQYLSPPRLKVVQEKKEEAYKPFNDCDVLVTNTKQVICKKGEFFVFTPIFMFDEFCVHNPYALKQLQMIRERTFDPDSEVAQKCRNLVSEPCPEDPSKEIRYATHLNFLIAIHDVPELVGIPVLATFFLGEFRTGSNLLALIRARCSGGTPLYAWKFQATPTDHKGGGFEWYGLDISNPSADYDGKPFVEDAAQFEQFKKLHEEARADKERIRADYDDRTVDSVSEPSDTLGVVVS